MRDHGIDIPDPKASQLGLGLPVRHLTAQGLDLRSARFRRALFVTCGPLGAPLSGNLVISGSHAKIDVFVSCVRGRGFNLPDPVASGSDAGEETEWAFDLANTGIDLSSTAWNRAAFVTCFQGGAP